MDSKRHRAIEGSLLGTAVGDALGLPCEGLSRQRISRFYPGELRHRLVFGRGMISDDTEHSLTIATALSRCSNDAVRFQTRFGWSLRWWLLALPAGVGLSTAKAIVRLWLGFPATRAGVHSAGNGAAMRSAVIGAALFDQPELRRVITEAACVVTHNSPLAIESAILVAEATAMACTSTPRKGVQDALRQLCKTDEMRTRFAKLEEGLQQNQTVAEYAIAIGCSNGVSGFAPNTVAVALYSWLRHRNDYEMAIKSVIECGGDTDSVAAITGGICGAEMGTQGIPQAWLSGLSEWPRNVTYIKQVAEALAKTLDGTTTSPPPLFWPGVLVRNALFLAIVLCHGFRRLAPPY